MSELKRDELLGGLGGRRASTQLFAIQRRTAYLALEARHAAVPVICEGLVELEERAFLATLATGRRVEVAPTIQDLERFAPRWAYLVPADPGPRADLAHRLATTYVFRARDVPQLRRALALDDDEVREAYERRHGTPLYETSLPTRERIRWWWSRVSARLEQLPPSWAAFGLTLTQTVGAGVLALPIAFAGIGPLPGLVLLVVLGLVNVLTVAAVAETFARTGSVRFGGAYFGRVVHQYLGRSAAVGMSVALGLLSLFVLLAYYLGLAGTLAEATGVHAVVWASALFGASLYLIGRGKLEATVATSLLVGAVNIGILVLLSVLAFGHLEQANMAVSGDLFEPGVLQLIFGVVLLAFFGHTSVGNGARLVLHRDRSGRSLIRGTVAAMITAIVLYCVWVLAVGGAVDPERLASETSTAIVPVAEVVGPVALGVGAVFVVLAMGMAAVQFSLGMHHQVSELPFVRGQVAGFLPIGFVFVLAIMALVSGEGSFAGPLGFIGTLSAPLIAGVFPVLLLTSSRRRGDYVVRGAARWIGRPTVVRALYLLFLAAIVVHGAVVWQTWPQRAAALAVAVAVAALTAGIVRSGALRPSATVELRRDRELGRDRVKVTGHGQPVYCSVEVTHRDGTDERRHVSGVADLPIGAATVRLDLRGIGVDEVDVWLHEVDPSGASVPLDLPVSVVDDRRLSLANGRGRLPATAALEIALRP